MTYRPDWYTRGTPKQLEEYIGNNFKFKGPGWYLNGVILVFPLDRPREAYWHQNFSEDERFELCSYISDPRPTFNLIVRAPERE